MGRKVASGNKRWRSWRGGPQRAMKPNVIRYNAVTSACEKGGQWQCAPEVLEGAPQRAMQPDVISYNAVTSACEKGGQWQCALELLEGGPAAGSEAKRD